MHGLEQLVTQPTRDNHILEVVPGISDHEAVTFHMHVNKSSSKKCTMQYRKANN